jgi:hypothetical protein
MLEADPVLAELPFMRSATASERYARFTRGLTYAISNLDSPEFIQQILTATLLPREDGDLGSISHRIRSLGELLRRDDECLTDKVIENRAYEGLKRIASILIDSEFAHSLSPDSNGEFSRQPEITRDDARAILASVTGQREPQREVTVDITLRDDPRDDKRFTLTNRTTFVGSISNFAVAIVPSPELVDHVLAHYPRVIEVWSTGGLPIAEATPALIDGASLVSRPINTDGMGDPVRHRLEPVDAADTEYYVGDLLSHYPDVQLFACDIPLGSAGSARVHAEFSIAAKKNRHCCYWIAEGAMFVQRITVDYGLFTFGDGNFSVRILPFMANIDTTTRHDQVNKRFEAMVDNWMVKGQGIMVVWSSDE